MRRVSRAVQSREIRGRRAGEIELNIILNLLSRSNLRLSDINTNLIILEPPPDAPLFPHTIPLDLLPLLRPPLHSLHHRALPRIAQLARCDTNDTFSIRSGLTCRAEIVDFFFGETTEEREGSEVGHHPGVQIRHVGNGVEESSRLEDVCVFGAECRSENSISS